MDAPIRVLHLVTAMNRGGLENMIMNYYRAMDRSKVQFDFLVHKDSEGAFDQEIRELGGRIFVAPSFSLRNLPAYKKRLLRLIKEHPEIRIFHSHLNAMSAIPLFFAKLGGVPVRIAHAHNSRFQNSKNAIILNLIKKSIRLVATDLIGCSNEAAQFMFGAKSTYRVIRNAINPVEFRFNSDIRNIVREEFGVSDDDLVIGNVGNLRAQKNHIFLLKVFKDLLNKRPSSKLLIVGRDNGELDDLLKFVKENDLYPHVVFAGPRSDVNRILQAIDVFVMPSIYEGLPVVSIEAQASGLPCIFSDAVTEELALSDKCKFVSLEDSLDNWSGTILSLHREYKDEDRDDKSGSLFKKSGYDVRVESQELLSFYLDSIN